MWLLKRSFDYWFTPRFFFNRLQLNMFILAIFTAGVVVGMYLIVSEVIIPRVFAATSPWVQTDWSGGSGASTTNQYSAVSSVDATTTSGQLALSSSEEASNTGFESNLTGWQGGSLPTSISGLQLWFKADALSLSDGDAVSSWTDSSSNSNHATQGTAGNRPTYKTNILNGQPIVRFDGNDSLSFSSVSSTLPYSVFYVGKKRASGVAMPVFTSSSGNNPYTSFDYTDNNIYLWSPGRAYRQVTGGRTSFYISSQVSDASTDALWFDGASQSLTLGSGSGGTTGYDRLGVRSPDFADGDMGEVIFYNTALSTTDRKAVEAYLQGKYGISSGYLTITRDTSTTYSSSSGSAKLVAGANGGNFVQSLNVGDTNSYTIVAYAKTDGSAVSSSDVELYYNGSTLSTTYTSVGSGWYKLSGTLTGANASRDYGVQVKANKTVYIDNFSVASYASSGTLTSNIFDTEQLSAWGTLSYTSSGSTVAVKARSSNDSAMSGATAFSSCDVITSGADISANSCITDGHRYVQYQVALSTADTTSTPTFSDVSIGFGSYDTTAPVTNASSIAMAVSSGGRSVASGAYGNVATPYFSWTAGADDGSGSGLKGYCIYIGTSSSGNPATTGGLLQNSPVSTTGSTCGFIVSGATLDLSSASYLSSALADGSTYYINIKAIDNANNLFATSATFNFLQDATAPTNVAYISPASGSFGNVTDMNFAWPVSGGSAATDATAGVLGYQYQLNGTSGTWLGTSSSSACSLSYVPAATASYTFTALQDSGNVTTGTNVIYFRTVDSACNTSATSTYRTGSISYGGAAPTFAATCDSTTGVTVTPTSATSNSYAISWSAATPASGRTVSSYYYMINSSPPSSLSTITSNTSTYLATTATSVSAGALTGSVRGSNTVYVVVKDDAGNYSSSNCIKGTYTLDSTNPDPPLNLAASDASIKSTELWRASLGWDVPSYKGTGSLTYNIQISTDNSSWEDVATTTGTSYIDTVTDSKQYYWRVGAYDTSSQSQADISYATSVSLTPKGTFTDPADLSSGPTVSDVTTKKATITWSTSRASDSKVSYGIKSGDYFTEEPSTSTQVTAHEINLTNLSPGTVYYYVAKWTDEDGNTGTSEEKAFTTEPPPTVKEPQATSITIDSALMKFTAKNAVKAKISYGPTTAFGAGQEISTSKTETTYSLQLSGLLDDTKYFFRIDLYDSEGAVYEGDINSFTTLPRPKISNVTLQEVAGSAQPTVRVTWETNTATSSIVTYYPSASVAAARDQVNVELLKGGHSMLLKGLAAQTSYTLLVKGVDTIGNEAVSDAQRFTTATDTRPPRVMNLKVQGTIQRATSATENATAQLIVSWDTDEPAASQVQFGEGAGTTYSQATQEDQTKTSNHLVLISGLTPAKAYHLRALSKDSLGNEGQSIDTVTITPKATTSALDLVVGNLSEVFGFLKGLGR